MRSAIGLANLVRRLRPDWFVIALLTAVALATLWPCAGDGVRVFKALSTCSIALLFFLQGARLSRPAILAGVKNWRLHLTAFAATFLLFPIIVLLMFPALDAAFPAPLSAGLLFLSALPSVNQSSVALTSIANGNVPGAICAATGSNIIGLVLTPVLLTVLLRFSSIPFRFDGISYVVVGLLGPLMLGHLLRSWVAGCIDRNRKLLAIADRMSVLLVVYSVFSAAVVDGVWTQLQPRIFGGIVLIDALLLATVLIGTRYASRLARMPRSDEVAVVFCGSTKSLVTGIPIASALFNPAVAGMIIIPIMLYHQMQLLVCAWVARRYAKTSEAMGLLDIAA
jgi:solute carrier family 10 (sodium/bile acid cotransporter), member 7